MRTSITQSTVYAPQMVDSLKSVPTVSLVFQGDVERVEKEASVEFINFEDGDTQVDAGMERFGSYVTDFAKRSIRVNFRSLYGPGKLDFPVFEGHEYPIPPAAQVDSIDLRAGNHDMAERGAYMSNRFTDDTMLDMGQIAPHGRFVHVYLNGLYWGQYHLRERWSAAMLAEYYGGAKEAYEGINANNSGDEFLTGTVFDGTGQYWSQAQALVAAIAYTGTIPIDATTRVRARVRSGANWFALNESTFVQQLGGLVVSEIMYNPPRATRAEITAGFGDGDSFEFVELLNTGGGALDLTGIRFNDGIEFDFTGADVTSLAAGARVLIVSDRAAFAFRYGAGHPVAGEYAGNLRDSGETLSFVDALDQVVRAFTFDDLAPWPVGAGVAGTVEASPDLANWIGGASVEFVEAAPNGDGTRTVTYRSVTSLDSSDNFFIRLRVNGSE